MSWQVLTGESRAVLRDFPDNSIDCMVTDPPAGIAFLGKKWDSDHGGRDRWIARMAAIFEEALRVLKPGGYGLVWAIPRTAHWTTTALEDAGFEILDIVHHLHAQGFPKSLDIAKAIDKRFGAERPVIGRRKENSGWKAQDKQNVLHGYRPKTYLDGRTEIVYTASATDAAKQWDGWGTALKPAVEHWILVRKPLAEENYAANVLAWGVGGLNIAGCEVDRAEGDVPGWHKSGADGSAGFNGEAAFKIRSMSPEEIRGRRGDKGRWPANLVLSHAEGCRRVGTKQVKGCPQTVIQGGKDGGGFTPGSGDGTRRGIFEGYGDAEGMETVEAWECEEGCPVAEIDRQGGVSRSPAQARTVRRANRGGYENPMPAETRLPGYGDSGGASRFFPTFRYCPKPSRAEKERGCEELPVKILNRVNPGGLEKDPRWAPVEVRNNHPTVKPVALMRWFCRLVCPPGGTVLDPFAGSGTTGVGAILEGFNFLGIEMEPESAEIADRRCTWAASTSHEPPAASREGKPQHRGSGLTARGSNGQASLFGTE